MFHWLQNMDVRYDPDNVFPDIKDFSEQKAEEILDLDEEDRRMISYKIWDYRQDLDHEDVGQRRHIMNDFFDFLVEQNYLLKGEIPVKQNYRIEKLKNFDGYMYKLAQEFLTQSSTMEKRNKLEKMSEHLMKELPEQELEFELGKEEFNQ